MFYVGITQIEPTIKIDSLKAKNIERDMILQKLYYRTGGYYHTVKKLQNACSENGYEFTFSDIKMWLNKQAIHQIHMPSPSFIPRASFNSIQIPNECHQADILYMPHDKIGKKIYKYCLCVVDVSTRFKVAYPLTFINSTVVANALKQIYNFRKCPLITIFKIVRPSVITSLY